MIMVLMGLSVRYKSDKGEDLKLESRLIISLKRQKTGDWKEKKLFMLLKPKHTMT